MEQKISVPRPDVLDPSFTVQNRRKSGNTLWTDGDKVVKFFSPLNMGAVMFTVVDLLSFDPQFRSRGKRREMEEEMKEVVDYEEMRSPSVVSSGEKFLVMEKIDGKTVEDVLDQIPEEEREELGRRMARFLHKLHDDGYSLGDFHLSNVMIEDGALYSIDHEWAVERTGFVDRKIERMHFYLSLSRLEEDTQRDVLEGWSQELEDFRLWEKLLATSFSWLEL